MTIETLADDAIAVADALGIDTFVPLGYSLGGAITQRMVRDHHDRLDGMVLAATLPRFRASELRLSPGVMLATAGITRMTPGAVVEPIFRRMVAKRTADLHPWGVDQLAGSDPRILLEVGASLFDHDGRSWIRDTDVPTAVVVTEDDAKVRPRNQRAFTRLIPDATVHPIAGGHDAPVASSETFNSGVLQALESVFGRSADR